jgi:hypothetical protein
MSVESDLFFPKEITDAMVERAFSDVGISLEGTSCLINVLVYVELLFDSRDIIQSMIWFATPLLRFASQRRNFVRQEQIGCLQWMTFISVRKSFLLLVAFLSANTGSISSGLTVRTLPKEFSLIDRRAREREREQRACLPILDWIATDFHLFVLSNGEELSQCFLQ